MRFTILTLCVLLSCLAVSCKERDSQKLTDDCASCPESRLFSIDESKSNFVVDVFGRKMGTPDWQTIDEFLTEKLNSNEIDSLTVLGIGFEGGASYCVIVSDESSRTAVLNQLQGISTDLEETSYRIESVDDCLPED